MSAALEEFEMPSKRSGTPAEPTATYGEPAVLYVDRQARPEEAAGEARVHHENFIRRPSFAPRKPSPRP
jgi:hypothetical protein